MLTPAILTSEKIARLLEPPTVHAAGSEAPAEAMAADVVRPHLADLGFPLSAADHLR